MLHWYYLGRSIYTFSTWDEQLCLQLFSQGTQSAVVKLKPSAIPHGTLGQKKCEPWLSTFCSRPGLHLPGPLARKSYLTSNFKKQSKIPVVLLRTGYIILTSTVGAETVWVTHWKSALPLSRPACRLAPRAALQWDIWTQGEAALQQSHPSPHSACWLL